MKGIAWLKKCVAHPSLLPLIVSHQEDTDARARGRERVPLVVDENCSHVGVKSLPMVQQPSKMAHAREQWPGMARLNRDRTIISRGSHLVRPSLPGLHSFLRAFRRSPLGVWVGEGLKEEIAGERGP
eukprot:scaffold16335_cov27-Phaeocystis_antarctica.AAC.1